MARVRQATARLDILSMKPGAHPVISCYLKLEARDRVKHKYLTKAKNRVKALEYALPSMRWSKAEQEAIRADLARIIDYLDDEAHLPDAQGVAIFTCRAAGLFEVRSLPRVHRSRLVADRTPLVRELAASQAEFGKLFTVTLDRTSALIWEVTAYQANVAQKVTWEVTRGGRYHAAGARGDATGEFAFHNRIRDEKRRHMEVVARALFDLDRQSPGHEIVLASGGNDAAALEPFLHAYLAERLIGFAKLSLKDAKPEVVHQLTMEVRAAHARQLEARHIEELAEGLGTGWAVNGVQDTLDALAQGKIRFLLVRGEAVVPGFRSLKTGRLSTQVRDLREDGDVISTVDVIDDAIEEALRQRVALDVIYDAQLADAVDGLAGLLRFK